MLRMFLSMIVLRLLTACETVPYSVFDPIEQQDEVCMNSYGGEYGYCGKTVR